MGLGVGIDLGTSFSSVGVFRDDRFEIIANEEGGFTTPSLVAFTNTGRLIGNPAKNQLAINPQNTVFNAQRFIGRKFSDPEVQADMKHFPFKVIDRHGKPAIHVEYKGKIRVFLPEEIISMILAKMKEMAESYLGTTVNSAVITGPVCWGASQRQSIRDAGLIAGLNILSITAAPTCAAVAYGVDKKEEGERNILIFDLGGGTFSATLAVIEEGIIEVKSVAGDTHLGGEDFDNRLVNHFVNEFRHRYAKDLSQNARALCRLRSACERAKRNLSSSTRTTIELERLFEDIDFNASITRTRFEELCQDLFHSTRIPVDRVLSDAKLDKTKIHKTVLIGGSTRIPMVQKLVTDYFNGQEPSKSINPDQAACYGAAVFAAICSGNTSSKSTNGILLLDVLPLSIGIGYQGGIMCPVIWRNSLIPTRKSEVFVLEDFFTAQHNSDIMPISTLPIYVYEGERKRVKDNNLLGKIALADIHSQSQIEITIAVSHDLSLRVSALEKSTGQTSSSVITTMDRFSKEEIERMIADAKRYKADDEAEATRISAKNALESQIYSLKTTITDSRSFGWFEASENEKLEAENDKVLMWLDPNEFATTDEYFSQQKQLEIVENLLRTKLDRARAAKSSLNEIATLTPNLSFQTPDRSAEQQLFSTANENARTTYTNLEFTKQRFEYEEQLKTTREEMEEKIMRQRIEYEGQLKIARGEMEEIMMRQRIEYEEQLKTTIEEKEKVIAQKSRDYQELLEKGRAQI